MLLDFPKYLWAEAIATSVYLYNRTPHRTIDFKTPFELPSGSKLQPRNVEGIFAGYINTSDIFRIYIPSKKVVQDTRQVRFPTAKSEEVMVEFKHLPVPLHIPFSNPINSSLSSPVRTSIPIKIEETPRPFQQPEPFTPSQDSNKPSISVFDVENLQLFCLAILFDSSRLLPSPIFTQNSFVLGTSLALASNFLGKNHLPYQVNKPLPLIIWHGLGDNYKSEGMTNVAALAEVINPGTYTYIIRIEDEPVSDRSVTFFGNITSQIEKVCADLAADPVLSAAPAVDALGFSQGGQFLRGYIERCNNPPVRSLVTFGSQHNGISKFETCSDNDFLCRIALGFLRSNIWSNVVQNYLVPAQYFRDPSKLADYAYYLTSSNFLADINNEREEKNQTYKQNLASLKRFVMYLFQDDETVVPKESGWFAEVNSSTVTPLQERQMYKEDWLGLRTLDEKKALVFKTVPGRHMQLSDDELTEVFKKYFGPLDRKFDKETEISSEYTSIEL
ncbi:hypothetical protein EPUL_001344 [Erysiphe pulchra]|uniref:Palmitoyl-protein thioesterase 1 n=1 Tax=Erysiphe pulchra TaxID=225359 RepID=A0A2S4Q1J2_9PEZI|nr:hypothetical protein EPUL_001344 [Erysiphe pulchra]